MHIGNATVNPAGNPTGGGVLFVDTGALKYRGTSGSSVTVVNADSTLPGSSASTFVKCTADAVRSNTTTFLTPTGLSLSLEASTTYAVDIMLDLDQQTAGANIQLALVVGTSGLGLGKWEIQSATTYEANNQTSYVTTSGAQSFDTPLENNMVVTYRGTITTSGAGTCNIQFTQAVATVGNTTIRTGSWARFTKL